MGGAKPHEGRYKIYAIIGGQISGKALGVLGRIKDPEAVPEPLYGSPCDEDRTLQGVRRSTTVITCHCGEKP